MVVIEYTSTAYNLAVRPNILIWLFWRAKSGMLHHDSAAFLTFHFPNVNCSLHFCTTYIRSVSDDSNTTLQSQVTVLLDRLLGISGVARPNSWLSNPYGFEVSYSLSFLSQVFQLAFFFSFLWIGKSKVQSYYFLEVLISLSGAEVTS